jgi:DNA-directed RNA polymerase subunit F
VDIAEVAELEVEEEDSVVEEVVSVEAMMEERAVLKLNNLPPPSLSFKNLQVSSLLQPHRLKFFFSSSNNNSSLDFLLYS